jgi:hypothetical protein
MKWANEQSLLRREQSGDDADCGHPYYYDSASGLGSWVSPQPSLKSSRGDHHYGENGDQLWQA